MQSQLLPSYSSRLLSLALHPLVARRVASDCAFALGLIHGRHKQSPSTFFTFRASFGRIGQFELTVRSYKSNNLRYSFANRIVRYLPRLSALELPLSSKFIRRLLLQHPLFTTRLDICVDIWPNHQLFLRGVRQTTRKTCPLPGILPLQWVAPLRWKPGPSVFQVLSQHSHL